MIPWMREKFAEKRAKWLTRKKNPSAVANAHNSTTSTTPTASSTTELTNGFQVAPITIVARTTSTQTPTSNLSDEDRRRQYTTNTVANIATPSVCTNHLLLVESTTTNIEPLVSSHLELESEVTPPLTENFQSTNLKARLSVNPDSDDSQPATASTVDSLMVRVICPSARILVFQADVTKRLSDLKSEVILELCDDPESIQLFAADVRHLNPHYRLFRASCEGAELNETLTLGQLQIRNNESLILTARRSFLQQHLQRAREVPGPTEQIIENSTRYLPSNQNNLPMIDINEIFQQSNIQYEVRKVLISLAQVSASIIGSGPFAPRLIAMLKQRLINKRNHLVDTVQCLMDMGFKQEIAEYALKVNNNVYSTTLEWLIQNQNDDSHTEEHATMGLQRSQSSISPSAIVTNNEIIENTSALLEIVRIYSHRDYPPNEEIIESLTQMGFEEAAVITALKKTGNNKAAACEWLCGNRSGSLTELRDGLSTDSPILKIILELPQVQMNLSNPKTFLAFLAILENEQAIRVWRGDTDTTSVITHILQKYHEEKHILGINQFYNNR